MAASRSACRTPNTTPTKTGTIPHPLEGPVWSEQRVHYVTATVICAPKYTPALTDRDPGAEPTPVCQDGISGVDRDLDVFVEDSPKGPDVKCLPLESGASGVSAEGPGRRSRGRC